ncbi:hypothetical protein WICPIJ_002470 [Wickerhamomyces pijperi]|uniref:Uncharacterized protein n=1 Tax=Wickerhamomyces pijperi TaxID=599730 RepID=A0A9P8Q9K5_WICPI|nr:hypothetical protein WICPIJ_002470 [Wickerhamomyces pijperi]
MLVLFEFTVGDIDPWDELISIWSVLIELLDGAPDKYSREWNGSPDPVANIPAPLMALLATETEMTEFLWPCNIKRASPLFLSQKITPRSLEPDKRYSLSGVAHTERTKSLWPIVLVASAVFDFRVQSFNEEPSGGITDSNDAVKRARSDELPIWRNSNCGDPVFDGQGQVTFTGSDVPDSNGTVAGTRDQS